MPEIERLRRLGVQRKNKQGKVAASRNRMAEGLERWKAEAERMRPKAAEYDELMRLAADRAVSAELIGIRVRNTYQQQTTEPK